MKIGTTELYWVGIEALDADCVSSNLEGIKKSIEAELKICGDMLDPTLNKVEVQLYTLEGGIPFSSDGWGYTFQQSVLSEVVYYDTIEKVLEKLNRDVAKKFQSRR